MGQIIEFRFVPSVGSIDPPSKMKIRPLHFCEVDEANALINLHYEIGTPGVNLKIKRPVKSHKISGTFESFRKEVVFEVINSGNKKDFFLKAKAILGNHSKFASLFIKYA